MTMVLIAGFHRSGTSLLAQMFHEGGLFLGNDLLAARESNPHGHFEDIAIVAFHDRVLKANFTSWQFDAHYADLVMSASSRDELSVLVRERNRSHQHWGLKDPRVCLFLNAWMDANPDCYIVAIFRDFISTTWSLLKRHASDLLRRRGPVSVHLRFWMDHELPYRMWLSYNTSLLEAVKAFPERSLTIYHSQLMAGLDAPAALNARRAIGIRPVDVRSLIDHQVVETSASTLPPIRAELRTQVVQAWRDIETVAGPSGVSIESMIERAFDGDESAAADRLQETRCEFDAAISRYRAELARYTGTSPPRK